MLTVRPVEEWIESRRRHVEANVRRRDAGDYHGRFLDRGRGGVARASGSTTSSRRRAYFAGRDDFLEIDLTAAAAWGPLCTLLDVPEPAVPFPHVNRSQPERDLD